MRRIIHWVKQHPRWSGGIAGMLAILIIVGSLSNNDTPAVLDAAGSGLPSSTTTPPGIPSITSSEATTSTGRSTSTAAASGSAAVPVTPAETRTASTTAVPAPPAPPQSTPTTHPPAAPPAPRVPATTSKAAPPPPAAPPATTYANCTELRKDYPHGVGRPGAVDHVSSGTPVTNYYPSDALYEANRKSDRDNDGIACESH